MQAYPKGCCPTKELTSQGVFTGAKLMRDGIVLSTIHANRMRSIIVVYFHSCIVITMAVEGME